MDQAGLMGLLAASLSLAAVGCSARPTAEEVPLAPSRSLLSSGWQQTGSMADCRNFHTATTLKSGKVLAAGGYCRDFLVSAELYDPGTGTWSPTGSMATPRQAHTATLLTSGKVLVVGGENSSGALSTAELYDPGTGTWSPAGSTSLARGYGTATLLPSGKVLVAGGEGSGSARAAADVYDPVSGMWSATASMLSPRSRHTATLLPSGKVLVAAGWNYGAIGAAEVYDPGAGTWSTTAPLATLRYRHTATLLPSGKVLVAGGENDTVTLASAELYDPGAGTWSPTGAMAGVRHSHSANNLPDGRVLVVGGMGGLDHPSMAGPLLATAEVYTPAAGTWSAYDSLSTARAYHASALVTGVFLMVGGWANTPIVSTERHDGCDFSACNSPPGPCYGSNGTCSSGTCSYPPLPADTSCDDGNACTTGDACDGSGTCAGKPLTCPSGTTAYCQGNDLRKTASSGTCSFGTCGSSDTVVQTCQTGPGPTSCNGNDVHQVTYTGCSNGACASTDAIVKTCPNGCANGACVGSVCGNGSCEMGEDCSNCPQDCGVCKKHRCGCAGGDAGSGPGAVELALVLALFHRSIFKIFRGLGRGVSRLRAS